MAQKLNSQQCLMAQTAQKTKLKKDILRTIDTYIPAVEANSSQPRYINFNIFKLISQAANS
jgi:hypothetical protein